MASTFSDLGIELMATGENAGTWGTKTNTNLQIVEKAIAGYVEKSIAGGAQTTTLTITDGDTTESTSVARHAVIKLTGTITGNQIVTVPDSIEKVYIVVNGTTGSFSVQFKTASGTGITFGASDKGTRLVFSDGTNIVDAGGSVGAHDLNGEVLTLDADADTTITADTDDQIDIAIAGADDFRFTANTFTALSGSSVVIPDGGLTLGSTAVSSTAAELNILDGVTSTTAELNILDGVTSTAAELNLLDGITAGTVSASLAVIPDSNKDISGFRNVTLTSTLEIDAASGDPTIILDTQGADKFHIAVDDSDSDNLVIKSGGTVGSGNGLKLDSSGNLTVTGDLTVSGDEISIATNTSGNILVADGTNFNSLAVGDLSEISTIANDDVFLAVDTSGGGLKKVARSTVVSGLATSGAISNVVEDSTPQLGGDLDVNGNALVSTSNGNIALTPNGTGVVRIDGSNGIDMQSGAISIKNSGAQSYIDFYCESSNAHYARLQAPAHSAFSGNITLTLPATTDTVAGIAATQTFTNKTLTSPKINEDVAVTSTATELNLLDGVTATTTELNLIDGGSSIGTDAIADGDGIIHNDGGTMKVTSAATFKTYFQTGISSAADDITLGDAAVTIATSSGNITIDAQANDSDIIFKGTDGGADTTFLTLDGSDAGTAVFNHDIKIADDGQIGSASAADAMIISSGGIVTFKDDILIKDGGTIGSASDADSITIASNGVVTFSQAPVFPDGSIAIADLDIDGGTDIGADLVDADLFIVDDGAGGTNRKVAASRIKTYIGGGTQWQAIKTSNYTASAGEGVFANTSSGAFTVTLPASPSLGDEVTIVDYAGTADTNNITVGRNSSPIMGAAEDLTISIERAGITLVYVDSTQGWLLKDK